MGKGAIMIKDHMGGKAVACEITGAPDLAAMASLATGMASYTAGKIVGVSFTGSQLMTLHDAVDTEPYGLANQKAVLTFRDLDATGSKGPILTIRWPAPVDIMFTPGVNGDLLVTQAQGEAIAAMLSARLGRNLEFEHGVLWNKPRKR